MQVEFRQFLNVKKLDPEAVLPSKAKPGDAGYDVVAIDNGTWSEDGTYIQYRTGIAVQLPYGYHTELFVRSSISKYDLMLANHVGVCDNGYTGELLFRFRPTLRGQRNTHSEGFYDSVNS